VSNSGSAVVNDVASIGGTRWGAEARGRQGRGVGLQIAVGACERMWGICWGGAVCVESFGDGNDHIDDWLDERGR